MYELRLRSAGGTRYCWPTRARRSERSPKRCSSIRSRSKHMRKASILIRFEGRTRDLVNALRGWAEVDPSSDRRIALLREAAELARGELSSRRSAADCYQALISIEPDDIDALRARPRSTRIGS